MKTINPVERFASKFQIGKLDECWPWEAGRNEAGYGKFWLSGDNQAHRVMWLFERGPVPEGMCVLHKCDNPPCVNPNHLFLGTLLDNINDRHTKGRSGAYRGPKPWQSKFSSEQVQEMKKMRDEGQTFRKIATHFGCNPAAVFYRLCWLNKESENYRG